MSPGDVILVPGTGLIERLIEFVTVSPFSHAALVGRGQLIEAAMGGVRVAPLDKYPTGCVLTVADASAAQCGAAVLAAEARLGQGYGWADILRDAERDLLHLPVGMGRRWWRRGTVDCSMLVAAAWRTAGVTLTYVPIPSPGDIGYSPVLVGPRPWDRIIRDRR